MKRLKAFSETLVAGVSGLMAMAPWWIWPLLSGVMFGWLMSWPVPEIVKGPRLWAFSIAMNAVAAVMPVIGRIDSIYHRKMRGLCDEAFAICRQYEELFADLRQRRETPIQRHPTGKEYLN